MPGILAPLARFGIAGLLNTLVGFATIMAALWLGLGDVMANLSGYLVGLVLGFIINRQWTFRAEGRAGPVEIARYLGAFALCWGLNIGVVLLGVQFGLSRSAWLHLCGMAVYTATFFLLSRWFVFPRRRASPIR